MKWRPEFIANWTARQEGLEHGANKVLQTLIGLRKVIPELREWCCDPPPFTPLSLDVASIATTIKRKSVDKERIPDLGWTFWAWAEPNNQPFGLSIFFGTTSALLGNRITLSLPPEVVLHATVIRSILRTLIFVWNPDTASYNPHFRKEKVPFVLGEQTYFSAAAEGSFEGTPVSEVLKTISRREEFVGGSLYFLEPLDIEKLYLLTIHFGSSPAQRSSS